MRIFGTEEKDLPGRISGKACFRGRISTAYAARLARARMPVDSARFYVIR